MNIFGYTLRKPWVKYVNLELDLGEQVMNAVKASVAAELVKQIVINDLCDFEECDAVQYLVKVVKP